MLIVPIYGDIAGAETEAGLCTLSLEPCETPFLHDRQAMGGALTVSDGSATRP